MGAVLLCEFRSADSAARPWILGRLALLALRGGAELQFVGTERAIEVIAIRFADAALAGATLAEWRAAELPAAIAIRLLRMEAVPPFPAGLFP